MRQILQACRDSGIKLNSAKCKFLQKESDFLGRIVTEEGYKANPEYVSAILQMPPPTTKKELQAAIGRFVWLRSYLEVQVGEEIATNCFSELMNALNKLNRKDKKFVWTEDAQTAFDLAKARLTSRNIIYFADFSKTFIIRTDASDIAVGCAVLQTIDDKQRIVAVGPKTLNATQQRWCTTEKEAYAILWACEKFQYFLRGPKPFLLLTDHRSLIFMDKNIFANQKIARWQDRLNHFNFILEYIEGEENRLADMFSRPFGRLKTQTPAGQASKAAGTFYTIYGTKLRVYVPSWINGKLPAELLMKKEDEVALSSTFMSTAVVNDATSSSTITEFLGIADAQLDDPTMAKIIHYIKSGTERWKFDDNDHRDKIYNRYRKLFRIDPYTNLLLITWNHKECIVVPPKLRPYYLKAVHDDAGHFGMERVSDFLQHLWWPGKSSDIHNYVESCVLCTRRKGNYGKHNKPIMGHLLRGSKPFEVIYCDFVHMPQSPTGKRYILTIIDGFTRFLYCYPTTRDRATDAAKGLISFMLDHDIPKVISSDRGTHFVNSIIEEMCQNMGIKQNLHTAWRPQSSGNIERAHRSLKNALWATAADRNCSWVEALPYVRRAMNAAKNTATGCSPYFAVYGREPIMAGTLPPGVENRSTEPLSYGLSVQKILQKAHEIIQLTNDEADKTLENRCNPIHPADELQSGDEAYLHRPESVNAKESHMPWIGPYTVLKSNGQIVQIDKDGTEEWVHRFHLVRKIPRRPELDVDAPIEAFSDSPEPESGREHTTDQSVDLDPAPDDSQTRGRTLTRTPRRSTRQRRPPRRLAPQFKGKTYST